MTHGAQSLRTAAHMLLLLRFERKNFEAELDMIRTACYSLFLLAMMCTGLFAQDAAAPDVPIPGAMAVPAGEVAAVAVPVPPLNPADQAWLLTSAALVLFMTPGLAFFYGGLVGRKNVLSILMQCFMCMALVSLIWVTVGYSLAFSGANPSTAVDGTPADEVFGGFAGNPVKQDRKSVV